MKYRVFNLGGKQLKVSPFLTNAGDMLRCVNMDNDMIGAKTKRPGYGELLGTVNGSAVLDLFTWTKADGTTTYLYRNSGGILYYNEVSAGTASDWLICGGGTLTPGNHIGHTVLAETLIVDQAGGTCMSSTSGTSFGTVAAAPPGEYLATYQNRVYIGGTLSTLFYSSSGSGTDWATTGTSDSSSLTIPGVGKINSVTVVNDRVIATKNSGLMYRWDGYSLRKLPTNKGPASPYSMAETEDYFFYLNNDGVYGFNGERPEIISNAIQSQVYNKSQTGISGTAIPTVPGVMNRYNYLLSVGDTTDDLTKETVTNTIIKYDYQLNQFTDYSFANKPTAFTTYKDSVVGATHLVFGDSVGQCYVVTTTDTDDNGTPIEAVMEGILHFGEPESFKLYKKFWAFASPGCSAKIQIAATDNFNSTRRTWIDVGEFIDGVAEFELPPSYVGKFLSWRVYERSSEAPFTIYGFVVDLDILKE